MIRSHAPNHKNLFNPSRLVFKEGERPEYQCFEDPQEEDLLTQVDQISSSEIPSADKAAMNKSKV